MKEIELELPEDTDRDEVVARVEEVAASAPPAGSPGDERSTAGSGDKVLWLTDRKGRQVGVPASKIAYVEIGAPSSERRVGFKAP